MQVDCQIFTEVDTLVVEYPYCSMYFDRKAIEDKAYQIFGDDYEHAVMFDRLDERKYLDFSFLDNDQKYDVIHDLIYYYNVKPQEMAVISHNQIKDLQMKTSENITNLTKALFAFHGKVSSVKKSANNPHFKKNYADLTAIS
jgi:hypothetical protein